MSTDIESPDPNSPLSLDLRRNRAIFDRMSRIRFQNVISVSPENHYIFFKVVPFLVHTNFRGLPGFVDHPETPHGINNYIPDEETSHYINRYFNKKVKVTQTEPQTDAFVEFLSVMGSVGSVAQTKGSDFDVWAGIHKNSVDDAAFRRFLEKLSGIENWLTSMRLESHFFANDIRSVTNNVFASVDEESCASAQGLMLKDEFYRSSILMAGKAPFWWMVDATVPDDRYTPLYQQCLERGPSFSDHYIDLGNVQSIDKGEFFGAALWQLVKSLHYPFKSFIKMCLIEKYLMSDNANQLSLLSKVMKENILRSENPDVMATDSYLQMFSAVEEYFLKNDRAPDVDLLRMCFYMKVQPNLSGLNPRVHPGIQKRAIMDRYTKTWNWSTDQIKNLDTFNLWAMDDIMKLDNKLKVYMVQTFSRLTRSPDLIDNNRLITENDLKIITRKLMSYFMPKPKKAKSFCFSFDDNLYEAELSIARQEGMWRLYRGDVKREKHELKFSNLLFAAPHLSDLCLWTMYSGIYNPKGTKLSIFSGEVRIDYDDIAKVLAGMAERLTGRTPAKPDFYLEDPFTIRVFITCQMDPADVDDRISLFHLNSWSELFAEHYRCDDDFLPMMAHILTGYVRMGQPNPADFITFHTVSGRMKELITFKTRVADILTAFRSYKPGRQLGMYVGTAGTESICFADTGAGVKYFRHPDLYVLLDTVAREVKSDRPRAYTFDAALSQAGYPGAAAATRFKAGETDVFAARPATGTGLILMADELNRLSHFGVPATRLNTELKSMKAFTTALGTADKTHFHEIHESNGAVVVNEIDPGAIPFPLDPNATAGRIKNVKAIHKTNPDDPFVVRLSDYVLDSGAATYDMGDPTSLHSFIRTCREARATTIDVESVVLKNPDAGSVLLRIKMSLQHQLNVILNTPG